MDKYYENTGEAANGGKDGKGGYSKKAAPADDYVRISGAGASDNFDLNKEGDGFTVTDFAGNTHCNGDQPSFEMPPFADGKDLRVKG